MFWSHYNGSLYHGRKDCPLLLSAITLPASIFEHDPNDPKLDSTRSRYVPCEFCCDPASGDTTEEGEA